MSTCVAVRGRVGGGAFGCHSGPTSALGTRGQRSFVVSHDSIFDCCCCCCCCCCCSQLIDLQAAMVARLAATEVAERWQVRLLYACTPFVSDQWSFVLSTVVKGETPDSDGLCSCHCFDICSESGVGVVTWRLETHLLLPQSLDKL